ncbi:MAG: hypothetical protein M3256_08460 [Actinomycetota bacterium]|nr:hypothetical protein [Actinomycetota bacterium]
MDIKPRQVDNAVVLDVLRELSDGLPSRTSPLLDRLFALECSIRGGAATRVVAEELGAARREAEWRISDAWEPDVPHVAELGQAISTSAAAGSDPSSEWIDKLNSTVERLVERRSKFKLETDPLLLAAVIRGMGAVGQKLPPNVAEAARAVLERRPSALPASEMAEALSRHHEQDALARDFAAAAFAWSVAVDGASASGQWWLAERWLQIRKQTLPQDPERIRAARLTVLSTTLRDNARARAMALEAVGRSVDRLIVDTPDNLEATRTQAHRRRVTELYFWRAAVAIGVALLAMFNIEAIVGRIDGATGIHKPGALLFQSIFGLGCAVMAFALTTLVVHLAKVHRGIEMPRVERTAEVFIPLMAGLAGAILHQG